MASRLKLYRWLLRLYPARFREEYEGPMERQFRDEFREAKGLGEQFRLWLRALWDVATTAPSEIACEAAQDLKHSARLYRRRWASTALAIGALGFAIGISAAVFSVLSALLLRSLPFLGARSTGRDSQRSGWRGQWAESFLGMGEAKSVS